MVRVANPSSTNFSSMLLIAFLYSGLSSSGNASLIILFLFDLNPSLDAERAIRQADNVIAACTVRRCCLAGVQNIGEANSDWPPGSNRGGLLNLQVKPNPPPSCHQRLRTLFELF